MTEAPESKSLVVVAADRVDKAIAHHFPAAGRKQIARLFDDSVVKVNGKRVKKGDRVAVGDVIELAEAPIGDDVAPLPDPDAAARFTLLLERPDLIVIAKPAGMPSQPLRAGELGTAANGIAFRWPECTASVPDDADPRDGGLVHRLDIGTSGALIAARTTEVYQTLREAFSMGQVEKHYLAITVGRPVSRECDAPLVQRGKRAVVDMTDGLMAQTAFDVIAATATHAVVRCVGRTGRTHQVRAHLAHVGAPIVGDTLYGAEPGSDEGFFLHAERVAFAIRAERIEVSAPLPDRFTAMLASLGLALP